MSMKGMFYTLDGKVPVPCPSMEVWAAWFETANRQVAKNEVEGGVVVSTAFLGMNHAFFGGYDLFETAVFYEGSVTIVGRYATWDEACEGHITAVADAMEKVDDINKRLAVATAEIWKVRANGA